MPDFEDILKTQRTVFADKSLLSPHHVPKELPYREEELRRMMTAIAPVLQKQRARNIFAYGQTGTGKSACTRQVLGKLEERKEPSVRTTYMNCRVYDSRYKILQKIITEFHPSFAKTGYSFAVLYEKLLDWIEEDSKRLVIALDEIDMIKDLDNAVYTLTRANDELRGGSISIIGVSNKVNFKQRLDSRSKSALCEEEIVFQPYNAEQLAGILRQRCETAFKPSVVEESAINYSSAIAAGENGDARYALALMLRAGELADRKKLEKITDKEVEDSRREADEDKAFEVISALPEHQQLVLYAIATLASDVHYKRLVEDNGGKVYFSGEVYERYVSTARKTGKEPRTSRWYREYLGELESLGLITTVGSGKGIRGHTTLIKLAYDAAKVKHVIEKTLLGE